MSVALPEQVNYAKGGVAVPPNSSSVDVVLRPSNGQSFGPNSTAVFDFNTSGYIVGDSLYIRYKYAFTNLVGAEMKGTPVYTPIQSLRVMCGSQQLESISNYNVVANMITTLSLDVAQRYGQQSAYGYNDSTSVPSLEALDGRTLVVNEAGSFSAPLPCVISYADKYLPAGLMPQLRVELTFDTLASMFRGDTVAVPTGMTLTNVELCYKQIEFGAEVDQMVRASGMTHIKTQSYMNSSTLLPASSVGLASLVFNTRLASIKSAFLLFSNNTADSNGAFDSVDITKSNGQYSLLINGKSFPQTPLNTSQNKAGILQALRGAIGSVFDKANSLAINAVEFNRIDGDAVSLTAPGKFIIGIDTEILGHSSDLIMSGTSSASSSITANIQLGTATTDSHNCSLVLAYDALYEIDFVTGQTTLKM